MAFYVHPQALMKNLAFFKTAPEEKACPKNGSSYKSANYN
jgi:hypothetical protein